MKNVAILFTQISPLTLACDPFILDYHRLILSHYCDANGFEIFDNTILGGVGEKNLFKKDILPNLENILTKSLHRPKFLLVCHLHEIGTDIELITILKTLSKLNLEVATIYKNEESNHVRLLGTS